MNSLITMKFLTKVLDSGSSMKIKENTGYSKLKMAQTMYIDGKYCHFDYHIFEVSTMLSQ